MSYDLPMKGQVLRRVGSWSDYNDPREPVMEDSVADADVITSEVQDSTNHRIVLDIDMPVKVVESTTPGHHHLYIEHDMSWEEYEILLKAMADVGLIEQGYVNASLQRGYTAVRLPWVKKEGKDA